MNFGAAIGVASTLSHILGRFSICSHYLVTGSAVKEVRRVSVALQGNPGSQDLRERKASNSQGTDGMLTRFVNWMHLNFGEDMLHIYI